MPKFLPKGKYQKSCASISVDLFCLALTNNQEYVPATFNLTTREKVNLANLNGHLVNLDGDAPNKGFIPGGPYMNSVVEVRVVLSAVCTRCDLSLKWSTLELTELESGIKVVNKDGELWVKEKAV